MQADQERTLSNLHILGALSHNDKLMTNEDYFDIYSPTSFRGLYRSIYGERRASNISRICQTVRSGINFAQNTLEEATTLMESPLPANCTSQERGKKDLRVQTARMRHLMMCNALSKAKAGLENLMQTYVGDSASVSQVQLVVHEIDLFIELIRPHTESLNCFTDPSRPSLEQVS